MGKYEYSCTQLVVGLWKKSTLVLSVVSRR